MAKISEKNPFDYKGALHLDKEMIREFFVQDNNLARLVPSTRNVYIHGERGSGKSMTLLYHALETNPESITNNKKNIAGIYVPCNTTTNRIRDIFFLKEEYQQKAISEHILVLQIATSLFNSIEKAKIKNAFGDQDDEENLKIELEYLFASELPKLKNTPITRIILLFLQRELNISLRQLRSYDNEDFYENAFTFSSLIMPLLNSLRRLPVFSNTHFSFLIDDAQDLQTDQRRILNSWVGLRDFSYFSFKIAAVKNSDWDYLTIDGSTIVEHHDYNILKLEQDLQTKGGDFSKQCSDIVERRLKYAFNEHISAYDFFPPHPKMVEDIKNYHKLAEAEAIKEKKFTERKKISDFSYKMERAYYFKNRANSKRNLPPYSGFSTIVHMSTGVIRNLLDPCYHMYAKFYADNKDVDLEISELRISPKIQQSVIRQRSEALWNKIDEGLNKHVEDCTSETSDHLKNLFHRLAEYFRERLLHHSSEPRVVQFSISERDNDKRSQVLEEIFEAASRAKILYIRRGSAKDNGRLEKYYVPNRLLWPRRGLDPEGQAGVASIREIFLYEACLYNKKIPTNFASEKHNEQADFFNDTEYKK